MAVKDFVWILSCFRGIHVCLHLSVCNVQTWWGTQGGQEPIYTLPLIAYHADLGRENAFNKDWIIFCGCNYKCERPCIFRFWDADAVSFPALPYSNKFYAGLLVHDDRAIAQQDMDRGGETHKRLCISPALSMSLRNCSVVKCFAPFNCNVLPPSWRTSVFCSIASPKPLSVHSKGICMLPVIIQECSLFLEHLLCLSGIIFHFLNKWCD